VDTTHTTFKRLSEEDVRRFTFSWYKHPAWKIGFFIMLGAVLIRWVTR
jgi:hypothetical protein